MTQEPYYKTSSNKAVKKLSSDTKEGLSDNQVRGKREEFGENKLPRKKSLSKLKIIIDQVKSPLIYILILAGLVVLYFQDYTDAIVIFGAVFLNTIVGYIQESKASEALAELSEVIKIKAEVIRGGHKKIVDQKELVPGDIVILEAGNKVPADGRIIEAEDLRINEAPLTGEWLPAEKKINALSEDTPVADRDNMAYMGCMVESGNGKMVVTHTGTETEMGKIASLVRETKEDKTPLQQRLAQFSEKIGIVIGFLCVLIFLGGAIRTHEILRMFETAVAVAVAAIPEGLPVAMTVILALGMQRILKRKGLVRKLSAAETLGSTSVACTDKTLTLTEGKMVPSETFTISDRIKEKEKESWEEVFLKKKSEDQTLALTIASLCNEGFVQNPEKAVGDWQVGGKPTDKALVLAGAKVGLGKPALEEKYPELDHLSFNSERKYVASLRYVNKEKKIYVCGAPEKLIRISTQVQKEGEQKELTEQQRKEFQEELEKLTNKGLRVIALAYKEGKNNQKTINSNRVRNLTLVGFIGFKDPLRKEAEEAIKTCKKAGMRPVLVTGDHLLTAKAVAEKLDLHPKDKNVLTGSQLDEISEQELKRRIKDIDVYARVEPRHKLRIVKAWQSQKEVVAMTGDGVNDSPALKKADIGVALGSGTDVAKEVSELVLLTDNFNIMVSAVEEGRAILDNIRKVITYLLSDSFSETVLIGATIILGLPLPITAVQILWVNLIEDSLPSIALAFEPKEEGIMKREPQPKNIPLLTKEMKTIIFIIGLLTDAILLGVFFWLFNKFGISHLKHIQTMVFASLGIDSLFYVFSCKNLRKHIWDEHLFSNKVLLWGWVFGLVALLVAIYVPLFQKLLGTVPLGLFDWTVLFGLGVSEIVLIELAKHYFIGRHQTEEA